MQEFNYTNLVKNLPDAFAKDKESNNYKLLAIKEDIDANIEQIINQIFDILDFDNATGKTLDLYGERIGIKRGSMTDAQYLIMLRAQIAQNMSDGTRDSIAKVLSFILQCNTSDIQIKGGENTGEVIVDNVPLALLINAGFEPEKIIEIINTLLSVGVVVQSSSFTGTFEYATSYGETSDTKGYGDLDGTIGGYYGTIMLFD